MLEWSTGMELSIVSGLECAGMEYWNGVTGMELSTGVGL